MRYDPIDPQLFIQNRRRFVREMQADSIAIFHSNDQMPRNGDQYFPFRQNSNLYYLTGLDQPEVVLVLFPDCVKEKYKELVFIKRSTEKLMIWEGYKYTKEDARRISGIERVHYTDEIPTVLHELMLLARRIYLNVPENDRFQPEVLSRDARFAEEYRRRYPAHEYLRSQPILKKLVMIKSELEIQLLRRSIDITAGAFRRILAFVRPGVMEYEVEAEITHEFAVHRALHGYHPIVGSGTANNILHYNQNDQSCKDGDMLLLDFGAEYANYSADLTRTIPVSGRFTQRQQQVYHAVLRVMRAATAMLVPGNNLTDFQQAVGELMEKELVDLGLIRLEDIQNQDPDHPAYKKYFMHGTAHHLGLDVHDLSHRYDPFQAGMVFTCEPGIYIPEEGFGIRLENDILITDHEPIDLMSHIPVEVEEIEALMQENVGRKSEIGS
jgi:Xaa-Pro aminopeptidase